MAGCRRSQEATRRRVRLGSRVGARAISRYGARWRSVRMFLIDHDLSPTAPAKLAPAGRHLGSKRSGAEVVVRGLELSDRDFVASILEQLGWQSRIQRFLAPRPILSERDLSTITSVDGFDRGGTIAFAGSSPIGAAHYVRTAAPEVAEIAVEVVDDWQRRGVGRSLLAELRVSALRAGCRRLEWFAFESNGTVAALARDLLDCRSTRVGGGVVRWSAATCRLRLTPAPRIRARRDRR